MLECLMYDSDHLPMKVQHHEFKKTSNALARLPTPDGSPAAGASIP